jgi:site-specific recombinase XerD
MEPPSEPIPLRAALDWYCGEFLVGKKCDRTIEEYRRDLDQIFSAIPIQRVADLSLAYLDHYVAVHTPGLSPATLRRRLAALSSFLSALRSRDLIPHNVMERFARPEISERLPNYLSADQVRLLRSVCACDRRVFAMVVLCLETGIRAGELVRLRLGEVDLSRADAWIIVRGVNSKSKKDRVISLSEETARALSVYLQQRLDSPAPEFFLNRFGQPFTVNALEKLLKRYFVKAGFPALRVHDLRHTFAVHFLKQRRPLKVLQETLGHASRSTTAIYARLNNAELKRYFSSPLFK